MADPLSVAASVIAVAGLATSSCQYLYETLHRFVEAPNDLLRHLNMIRALQSTFAVIAGLETRALPVEMLSPEFRKRLHDCLVDLQAMETLAQSIHSRMGQGTRRRTLARVRLSLGDQRQTLKSHLDRIQSYQQGFSLDLLLFNMYAEFPQPDDLIADRALVN